MRPRAPALALAAALGLTAHDAGPARAAAPPAVGPASPTGPGYVLMDLPAIRRVLREGRGHGVLVHFWASWCAPCLEELPVIEKLAREMKPRGLQVLSLSLDDPQRAGGRVVEVLSQVAPTLTRSIAQIGDADAFISNFDARWEGSIPALFAYDPEGRLRGRIVGEASRRDLDHLVARILK